MVLALGVSSGFASLLHGWEQQCGEDGDDGDHNEQFDQCETWATTSDHLEISSTTP
jgi:hypothetical protein